MKSVNTKRFCYACDLKNDPELIASYIAHHKPENIWPEILESIKDAGILDMQIYRTGTRLFMIIETDASFDPNTKANMDKSNSKVQEWEQLMWTFQKALPEAEPGQKWIEMDQIFKL